MTVGRLNIRLQIHPTDSILILRMSAFGDIICALPVLRALRDEYPHIRIGWVVDARFKELVENDPAIDTVHVAPLSRWKKMARSPKQWPRLLAERRALKAELRRANYEVCVELQGILKSGFLARMAGCAKTVHMGSGRLAKRRWLFPGPRVEQDGPHAVDRMLPLARALGADTGNPRFDLHIPGDAQAYADAMFEAHDFQASGPLVALNPGAFAEHRMWPADRFVALARRLKDELDARIVVVGGPDDVDLAEGIVRDADVNALCTAGKTSLLQLAGVLSHCEALVTGDTGPQHMAYALGKKVVALFGPANPESTGPYGDEHIVIQKPFDCQPCYAHPTCDDYPCMKAIEVGEVVAAVREVLGR